MSSAPQSFGSVSDRPPLPQVKNESSIGSVWGLSGADKEHLRRLNPLGLRSSPKLSVFVSFDYVEPSAR